MLQVVVQVVVLFALASAAAGELRHFHGTSAPFVWRPAPGPVAGYEVEISKDGAPFVFCVASPCFSAQVEAEGGTWVDVRVVAVDADGNYGPRSEASGPIYFVPEPSSSAQLAAGVLALAALRWRARGSPRRRDLEEV